MTNQPTASGVSERDVDMRGNCSHCGGVHFGTGLECPYREKNMGEPCTVCGERTSYCCSDCAIDGQGKVYVCTADACRDYHEKKHLALLAKPAQGGDWVLVPNDPIEKQIEEGLALYHQNKPNWSISVRMREAYKAMIAAAPPQPIPTPDEALFDEAKERAAFEACVRSGAESVPFNEMLSRMANGDYLHMEMHHGWMGWKHRAALSRARPEEAIREAALEGPDRAPAPTHEDRVRELEELRASLQDLIRNAEGK